MLLGTQVNDAKTHEYYMRKCFALAKKAIGATSPNPYVGSVIVKNGEIISTGFHKRSGLPHAEANAISNTPEDLKGATLYCNLEPCCHLNKKTPPCAQAIIQTGMTKVIIANLDPNPNVSGEGVALLRANNIEVMTGILQDEGELLNEVFFTHIMKKRPFIHLKWAQTLDGKTATLTSDSKWITSESSRNYAHRERNLYDAIVVGSNTVNRDNPSLTIRINGGETCKKRVVLTSVSEINPKARIFTDQFKSQTIIIKMKTATSLGTTKQNLNNVLSELYKLGIYSIYVEGGMKTISHFINAEIFDRVSVFIAPKLLGMGLGLHSHEKELMQDALNFSQGQWKHIEQDMLFESKRNVCLQD